MYRVRARNSVGFSNYSDVVEILAAVAPVNYPTELARDDELTDTTKVSFSWTAPSNNGGSDIISYTVSMLQSQSDSGDDDNYVEVGKATETQYT